ncbi:MAG: ABC transporter ATP-binding protein [Candidatus Krumholzibacteriota bacterium]|nr:ABC transporter ATP-binding protein [Candidatus Krumholzibacteriota bacterium]
MVANNAAVLTVEKLHKSFRKVEALRGIDMVLSGPGVYGFLGPNGAGKTTTFKLISGLLRPTGGRVYIQGIDVQRDTRQAVSRLGILFDSPAYYPYLTGRENLEVFSTWWGTGGRSGIEGLLTLVGLSGNAGKKVAEYSWGMKRRLGIAAALLSDPVLILLDEPTNGLDPAGIADMRRLLPRLAYDQGRTVLLSSHRMEEVDQTCDHVTIINRGNIVAAGTPSELSHGKPLVEIKCSEVERARSILLPVEGIERVEQTGAERLLILSAAVPASAINSMLVENGIYVQQVMEKKESLEEIFFRLTGNGEK